MSSNLVPDRRVRRTRQLLQGALLDLIAEQGYDGLTVQEIAERATVGRATFYLHYPDKEHLLAATLTDLIADLAGRLQPLSAAAVTMERQTLSTAIFEHVAAHRRVFQVLLSERSALIVMMQLRTYFAELAQRFVIQQLIAAAPRPLPVDLIQSYAGGALLGLIDWWLTRDEPTAQAHPPARMGQIFWALMNGGLPHVLGLDVLLREQEE